jgi:hypothetical protein
LPLSCPEIVTLTMQEALSDALEDQLAAVDTAAVMSAA